MQKKIGRVSAGSLCKNNSTSRRSETNIFKTGLTIGNESTIHILAQSNRKSISNMNF